MPMLTYKFCFYWINLLNVHRFVRHPHFGLTVFDSLKQTNFTLFKEENKNISLKYLLKD